MAVVTWIKSNVLPSEDGGGTIFVEALYSAYKRDCPNGLGKGFFTRTLSKVFLTQSSVVRRDKATGTRKRAYCGLKLREKNNEKFSLQSVQAAIHSSWNTQFDGSLITANLKSQYICDGNAVYKTVTIDNQGSIQCAVSGRQVHLEEVGIQAVVELSPTMIEASLIALHEAKLCRGYKVTGTDYSEKSVVWHEHGNEKFHELSVHSRHCNGLIGVLSASTSCVKCLAQKSLEKKNANNTLKRKSLRVSDDASVANRMQQLTDLLKSMGIPENTSSLIEEQCKNSTILHPRLRRWNLRTIRACLSWWCCSPKTYLLWKKQGYLILPSVETLRKHKNALQQEPGIHDNMLWMKQELGQMCAE